MLDDYIFYITQNIKNSRSRFRSYVLWVMGPTRFHCATLLYLDLFCVSDWRFLSFQSVSCLSSCPLSFQVSSVSFSLTPKLKKNKIIYY